MTSHDRQQTARFSWRFTLLGILMVLVLWGAVCASMFGVEDGPGISALRDMLGITALALPWLSAGLLILYGFFSGRVARGVSFLLGVILGHFVLPAMLISGPVVADYATRTKFDSELWKNAEGSDEPIRIKMVHDLRANYELLGRPRHWIDDVMGIPQPSRYFPEYDYVYWLGPERGFISIDSEWLAIKFENDVVVKARIVRD